MGDRHEEKARNILSDATDSVNLCRAITAALRSAESDLIKRMMEPSENVLEAANREWDGRMSVRSTGVWQAMLRTFAKENKIDIGLETAVLNEVLDAGVSVGERGAL